MSHQAPEPFVRHEDPEENPFDTNKETHQWPTESESDTPADVSDGPHRSALFVKVKRWLAWRLGCIALTSFEKLAVITFRGSALVADMINAILTAMGARSDTRFTLVVDGRLDEDCSEREDSLLTFELVHAQTHKKMTQCNLLIKPADIPHDAAHAALSEEGSPDVTDPEPRVSSQSATTNSASPQATHDAPSNDSSVGDADDASPEASSAPWYSNPGLYFLAHPQMHEDLFEFLDAESLVKLCDVHPKCKELVLHFAKSRLQDVIGQESTTSDDAGRQPGVIPRTIDAPLVHLLHKQGTLREILDSSPNGVRSLGLQLVAGPRNANTLKALTTLWHAMNVETTGVLCTYCHVEKSVVFTIVQDLSKVPLLVLPAKVTLVAQHWVGLKADDIMELLAKSSPKMNSLQVLFTEGHITNKSMMAVAKSCRELEHLLINCDAGKITDESVKQFAKRCPKIKTLNAVGANGAITNASLSLLPAGCHWLI